MRSFWVNLGRVCGVVSVVDLARSRGLRVAAAALTLFFALSGFDQMKQPALPMPEDAAASAEEIAERLRAHVDDDVDRRLEHIGIIYAPFAMSLDTPLLHWCWPEHELGVEERPAPEGVPAYTGRLHAEEVARPLEVRFWITSPAQAGDLVAAARRGTEQCDDRPDYALIEVADFDRWGWRGVQALVTTENWTEQGDSGARATIVAARGALLAEVSWEWEFEAGGVPGRPPLHRGAAAARSVLAAVGGAPAGPAPSGPELSDAAPAASMAAALPPPSVYGKDMTPWTARRDGPRAHELVCGNSLFEETTYGGAPAVTRRLIGEVSVREDVLFVPDEQSAEWVRTGPLGWDGSCFSDEDEQSYSINPRLEPLTQGPWTGEIKTFAVQRPDPPHRPDGADRRFVAHVAVGVRRGTTVVYLRWQGPAGTDPAATLRTGRAALIRTLGRLPSGG